jgi:S-DNA-T family DNA segregation ATPase FtsK/SpoIIIE
MKPEKYRERYESTVDEISNKAHTDKQKELIALAVEFVVESQRASISSLQRTFGIGYNQAANLMENLEIAKVVSLAACDGKRTVLIKQDA